MPEYAELHGSAQQLNEWAAGHAFSAAEVNLEHTLPHSLGVEVPAGTQLCALPGTAQWARFEMCARHRGKEVCVALRPMAAAATPPSSLPFCPTRAAVFGSTAPLCQHGEPCEVRTSRKAGKNCGRRYWVCPRARHEQCSCFEWLAPTKAECEADRAQRDWFPETSTSPTISTISSREIEAAGVAVDGAAPLAITMRRGMSGRVELHLGSRRGAPSGWHLRFKRDDGAYVYFIDGRTRVNAGAIWNMGVWGGAWRRSARGRAACVWSPFGSVCAPAHSPARRERGARGARGAWRARSPGERWAVARRTAAARRRRGRHRRGPSLRGAARC